jgi:hypothetical protein
MVEAGNEPMVTGLDDPDAPVGRAELPQDVERTVRGTIVDGEQFEFCESLGADALNRSPDEAGAIEDRHYNGECHAHDVSAGDSDLL